MSSFAKLHSVHSVFFINISDLLNERGLLNDNLSCLVCIMLDLFIGRYELSVIPIHAPYGIVFIAFALNYTLAL